MAATRAATTMITARFVNRNHCSGGSCGRHPDFHSYLLFHWRQFFGVLRLWLLFVLRRFVLRGRVLLCVLLVCYRRPVGLIPLLIWHIWLVGRIRLIGLLIRLRGLIRLIRLLWRRIRAKKRRCRSGPENDEQRDSNNDQHAKRDSRLKVYHRQEKQKPEQTPGTAAPVPMWPTISISHKIVLCFQHGAKKVFALQVSRNNRRCHLLTLKI